MKDSVEERGSGRRSCLSGGSDLALGWLMPTSTVSLYFFESFFREYCAFSSTTALDDRIGDRVGSALALSERNVSCHSIVFRYSRLTWL